MEDQLNWEVKKLKLYGINPETLENIELDDSLLVNGNTHKKLSIVSEGYNVLYNERFKEITQLISDELGLEVHRYDSFRGGKRVMASLKNTEKKSFLGEHQIENNIIIINSHDKTTGLKIGTNSSLFRCENMFSSTDFLMNVRHNSNMDENLEELKHIIIQSERKLEEQLELINGFNKIEIEPELIEQCKKYVFNIKDDELSTAMKTRLGRFDESMNQEMGELGQNLFGLWNGVTHFTTHNYTDRSSGDKYLNSIFGKRKELNDRGLEFCQKQSLVLG